MATCRCNECEGTVSTSASRCPHCGSGHPVSGGPLPEGFAIITTASVLIMSAIWFLLRAQERVGDGYRTGALRAHCRQLAFGGYLSWSALQSQ